MYGKMYFLDFIPLHNTLHHNCVLIITKTRLVFVKKKMFDKMLLKSINLHDIIDISHQQEIWKLQYLVLNTVTEKINIVADAK